MKKFLLMLAATALVGASFAGPASAAPGDGTVTVVHGIPGLTVDVYVNDALTLDNFAPDTVTDPITLPAGTTPEDPWRDRSRHGRPDPRGKRPGR